MFAEVREAQDVGEEPRGRIRVAHVEKYSVEGMYGELRGDVRMNGPAG